MSAATQYALPQNLHGKCRSECLDIRRFPVLILLYEKSVKLNIVKKTNKPTMNPAAAKPFKVSVAIKLTIAILFCSGLQNARVITPIDTPTKAETYVHNI